MASLRRFLLSATVGSKRKSQSQRAYRRPMRKRRSVASE